LGTPEWWQAMKDGRIPVFEEEGAITRIFESGHGDWPEFEVSSREGSSRWTRLGDQAPYALGRVVRIRYVRQRSRMKSLGQPSIRIVLSILIKAAI
jgi:hypothetical protein